IKRNTKSTICRQADRKNKDKPTVCVWDHDNSEEFAPDDTNPRKWTAENRPSHQKTVVNP
ncbi:MAG TPA: hypothetical protein DCX73_10810, partial [Eubacterium sp.]|nr:hypothetical protein [Eubacterium sp.]